MQKKNIFSLIIIFTVLIFGFWYGRGHRDFPQAKQAESPAEQKDIDPQELSWEQSAEIGETKTLQLLVQIAKSTGDENQSERGNVVLTAPEDKQFSTAEKEGFLIIKVKMTEMQAQLLTIALEEKTAEKDAEGNPVVEQVKPRKFRVDLASIGIGENETTGRVVADKVFDANIFLENQK
jgi:hypothetical protein